jgi:hypothetical protein
MRDAVFVSMLEARRRVKVGEPIIQRVHPQRPDARFVMSLSGGEAILTQVKGVPDPVLLNFKTAASTTKQMLFVRATDARRSSAQMPVSFNPGTFPTEARKVTVDPLGRIRWAND